MAYESNAIFWIEVEKIVPNPFQPRREFDQQKLRELADSIRMYGVLQPLVVTRREIMKDNGAFTTEYELIAGERRLRASKLAGLTQVPVLIRSGEETSLMKLELAIIENLQREDLNAVDRALAFKQLVDAFGFSHSKVAEKVGRSREYVANSIRLLQLPEAILNALRMNDISDGHARTLLMLNDRPEEQDVVFREILMKKLSVREVERIARKIATEKVRKKQWLGTDPELIEIEKEFTETLGTRVQIQKTDFGGKLTIDYFELAEVRRLLDVLHGVVLKAGASASVAAHLEALTRATPLAGVASAHVPMMHDDANEPDVPYEPAVPGEQLYTRHDTMEVPEVPEELEHPPFAHEDVISTGEPHIPEASPFESVSDEPVSPPVPLPSHEVHHPGDTPQPPQPMIREESGMSLEHPVTHEASHEAHVGMPAVPDVSPVTRAHTPLTPAVPTVPTPEEIPREKLEEDESDLYAISKFGI